MVVRTAARNKDWVVKDHSEEVVVIPPGIQSQIEYFLASYLRVARRHYRADYPWRNFAIDQWGIPSPIVRLDMPPALDGFKGTYEVEANTAGLGIMASEMTVPIAERLAALLRSSGLYQLGYGVFDSRTNQAPDLQKFMNSLAAHGIETIDVGTNTSFKGPVMYRAGQEDIDKGSFGAKHMERSLLLPYDGGGHKGYLEELMGAVRLSTFASLEDILEQFPDGFVIKPRAGWGSMNMFSYSPNAPYKRASDTWTRISDRLMPQIINAGEQDNWLVQPFLPPQVVEDEGSKTPYFRIWRLTAVWDVEKAGYRLAGGFWSQRKSIKVHGASDTISGPLMPA